MFGEQYAQGVEATGRSKVTLLEYARVARQVPHSRRRAALTFTHHQLVAAKSPEDQARWLDDAEANCWSVEEMRGLVRPDPALSTRRADTDVLALSDDERGLVHLLRDLQVTPARVERLVANRLGRIERTVEAERIRALARAQQQHFRRVHRVGDGIELHHDDFRSVDLELESADLVFTDPPYHREFLPLWEDLGKFAATVLKPGRLLVTYSGNLHVPEVIAALSEHLTFVAAGAVFLPGGHTLLHGPRVHVNSKPLFFFAAGEYEPRQSFSNGYWSTKGEKQQHVWQQEAGCAREYVAKLTQPGELVVDPFVGSGTTGVAAAELGRRFIGCDIDPHALDTAADRITNALGEEAA